MVAAQLAPDGCGCPGRTSPAAFQYRPKIEWQAHQAHVGFRQLGGGSNEFTQKR